MGNNKVNKSKFETLKCRNCPECKEIIEKENPGFNLWNLGNKLYLIKCSDGITRMCEVGDSCPSDCLTWEMAFDSFMKGINKDG